MSILSEEVSKRIAVIDSLKLIQKAEAHDEPDGRLRVSVYKGHVRYYHVSDNSNPAGSYLNKKKHMLVKELAQKDYRKKLINLISRERELLKALEEYYQEQSDAGRQQSNTDQEHFKERDSDSTSSFFAGPEELLWGKMRAERRKNIKPAIFDNDLFVDEWLSELYEKKGFDEDAPEFFTDGGIRVRSKTEFIIAGMLEKKGIPFYYEKPLRVKGYGLIHPDFTALNVRTRKTFYWEHMGMMDDPDYSQRALERINAYEMNGIFPGTELILTHETSMQPIRTRIIEKTIEKYLL